MTDPAVTKRVQRLLELPGLIEPLLRQRTALRAERRSTEAKLRRRIAEVRRLTLEDIYYASAANQTERDIILEAAVVEDDDCAKLSARVDQLTTSIEKVQADLDALDHERKALKAALEREFAAVIEKALTDRVLADVAMSGRRGVAEA